MEKLQDERISPYDLISDAYKALEQAKKEFDEYIREKEPMKLRDACEKAWLSVVLATDYLLVRVSAYKPRGRAERKKLLETLEKNVEEVKKLGLADRMFARSERLHSDGFYEGSMDEESFRTEIEKVERYLSDVQKVAEDISMSPKLSDQLLKSFREIARRYRKV